MEYVEVVNQNLHMQGFSKGEGFMYWSFTDSIVKTTMNGTVKCQAEIHGGHLGDIDYYDGRFTAAISETRSPDTRGRIGPALRSTFSMLTISASSI